MLKVGGIWCSPVEIEARLIEHPAVLEAAVVGRADENELIKPEAIVVLKQAGSGGAALTEELLAHCKAASLPTSTRAGASSWTSCRRPRPERSSASSCCS